MVAPLDWGLGHVTRCIPIIRILQSNGVNVVLAGNDMAKKVFSKEFPGTRFLSLSGYGIKYSAKGDGFLASIVAQTPKLYKAIRGEQKWLKKLIANEKIDGIISDNRLGLYSHKIPSVIISHQLNIITGSRALDALVRKINYSYINKFDECWVPDFSGSDNFSGILSQGGRLPKTPVKYVGLISRLKKASAPTTADPLLFVTLSGPEPQRSIFEEKVLSQLERIQMRTILLRGLPNSLENKTSTNPLVEIVNHLPAEEYGSQLNKANYVISRGGYSTIMDLAALQKPALLVPTPGQTEQEYICAYLSQKKFFLTQSQDNLRIEEAINSLKNHQTALPVLPENTLQPVIEDWLKRIMQ